MIRDIQFLRGIAVLAVVLNHTPAVFGEWTPWFTFPSLWTGVDLFLVISGFVIAKSFLPDLESTSHPWVVSVGFWIKRIYRLLPAAVFWASVMLLLAILVNKTGIMGPVRGVLAEYVWTMAYVANFKTVHYSLGPYWSLSLEEQFYAVLPAAAILLPFVTRPWMLAAMAIGALLAMVPFETQLGNFRVAPLICGVLLYQLSRTSLYTRLEPIWFRGPLQPLGIIALFAVLFYAGTQNWLGDRWIIITLASTLLVWLATYDKGYASLPGIGRVVEWVGNRSYSIYLAQMPALLLTYEIAARAHLLNGWIDAPIAWAAAVAFGALSYRWIEQPSKHLGHERSDRYVRTRGGLAPTRPPTEQLRR